MTVTRPGPAELREVGTVRVGGVPPLRGRSRGADMRESPVSVVEDPDPTGDTRLGPVARVREEDQDTKSIN